MRDWRQQANRRKDHQKGREAKRAGKAGAEMPKGNIFKSDLHGLSENNARKVVQQVIQAAAGAGLGTTHIEFVHGYNRGTTLRDVVREVAVKLGKRWSPHPSNDGVTFVEL